jgi:hypothetical protein
VSLVTLTALAGALALSACGDSSAPSSGTLSLHLTDAPFPYDSVARADMFVVRIDGKMAEADSEDASGTEATTNEDPSKGWVTLAAPDQSFNLLDLQNGVTTSLGQTTLPTGTYRGFRLILDTDRSSVTLKDGTVLSGNAAPGIKWPSTGKTGVKINLDQPINLVAQGTAMVIDFDLGASFVLRGSTIGDKGLLFKPVIRGVAHDITGSVSGSVRADSAAGAAMPLATVEALKPGTALDDTSSANVLRTTQADSSGAYHLMYLLPGAYEVRATPPSGVPYAPALLSSVTVASGADAAGSVVVLPHQ